jgi:hypothetical protein
MKRDFQLNTILNNEIGSIELTRQTRDPGHKTGTTLKKQIQC